MANDANHWNVHDTYCYAKSDTLGEKNLGGKILAEVHRNQILTCLIIVLRLRNRNHKETEHEKQSSSYHQVVAINRGQYSRWRVSWVSTHKYPASKALPDTKPAESTSHSWTLPIQLIHESEKCHLTTKHNMTYLIWDEVLVWTRYSRT